MGYSFEKTKVVDTEASEKEVLEEKKDFSFKEKAQNVGSTFARGVKILAAKGVNAYKESNSPENILKKKKFEAERTKYDAQIAKNKAKIQKYSKTEKKNNFLDW